LYADLKGVHCACYRTRIARKRFIWSVIATSVGRRSTLEAP
jgi:hypothetical protein